MADTVSKTKRSEIMRAVKSKETKIEIAFRKILWSKGFRYSKNSPKYFGKPDIVLKRYKTVIFIDSCFWHGCKKHLRMPKSNKAYWQKKIQGNIVRDKKINNILRKKNWNVLRLWEHEIKENHEKSLKRIIQSLKLDNKSRFENFSIKKRGPGKP